MASYSLFLGMAVALSSAPDAIDRHSESLANIHSYRLKIASNTALEPGGEVVRDAEYEIWNDRIRHKRRQAGRILYSLGETFARVKEPYGRLLELSVDATETRFMRGWDHERPYKLPLEFGRNTAAFTAVSCSLSPRDPTAHVEQLEATSLFWEILPGWPLPRIAAAAQLSEVPGTADSITRLRVESTDDPGLKELVGALIDLDQDHGWLVRRFEGRWGPDSTVVREVAQFDSTADGIWIPVETRGTLNGLYAGGTEVLEFEINAPIPDDLLQVQFPEGARVKDASGMLYIWGKGEPVQSFTSFEKFQEWNYARARELQSQGSRFSVNSPTGGIVLIIVNVVLVSLLILFAVLRRRLARSK